jgi:hypothetical protein
MKKLLIIGLLLILAINVFSVTLINLAYRNGEPDSTLLRLAQSALIQKFEVVPSQLAFDPSYYDVVVNYDYDKMQNGVSAKDTPYLAVTIIDEQPFENILTFQLLDLNERKLIYSFSYNSINKDYNQILNVVVDNMEYRNSKWIKLDNKEVVKEVDKIEKPIDWTSIISIIAVLGLIAGSYYIGM